MKFTKITLANLLAEIDELPSDWKDEQALRLLETIHLTLENLRKGNLTPNREYLEHAFASEPAFLDICRLFLGRGQETVAHLVCDHLEGRRMNWPALRRFALSNPARMAEVMVTLDLPGIIENHLSRRWTTEDILIERYRLTRGRAISGQKRGRALEDEVSEVFKKIGVPFERGVTFVGQDRKTAKCDFAIPDKKHPKIVLEAKGFEATGSKLTDFLGDVLKIAQAKEYHMYFFIVTDGRGWHNRQSDLRKVVENHEHGLIDMIYTRARLDQMASDVRHIFENE